MEWIALVLAVCVPPIWGIAVTLLEIRSELRVIVGRLSKPETVTVTDAVRNAYTLHYDQAKAAYEANRQQAFEAFDRDHGIKP